MNDEFWTYACSEDHDEGHECGGIMLTVTITGGRAIPVFKSKVLAQLDLGDGSQFQGNVPKVIKIKVQTEE